ncbi:MAG: hypothetical protein JRC69_08325 [Deltaproteobacteria bacterium]|nr:hypothetical protein [Deltaproteobacteria bacterium]
MTGKITCQQGTYQSCRCRHVSFPSIGTDVKIVDLNTGTKEVAYCEKGGEKVKAFIQLKPGKTATEEEIQEYCKNRLAGYKRPGKIEFRENIPTSIIGKLFAGS